MAKTFKQAVADIEFVRRAARTLFVMGDSIRPIVQRPIVRRFIGVEEVGSALDAGCGRGMYTRVLLKRARKVTAFDYSPSHVGAMTRRLGALPQLRLFVGSADSVPLGSEQFDVVVHCEVLEHIKNDRKVLSELFRLLRPGGKLVISVPVPPAPFVDKEHVREGYKFEQISGMLKEAGFEVVRHEFCLFNISKGLLRFEGWWRRNIRLPLPSLVLLPAFWERLFQPAVTDHNLPYDVVIEARKPDPAADGRSRTPAS